MKEADNISDAIDEAVLWAGNMSKLAEVLGITRQSLYRAKALNHQQSILYSLIKMYLQMNKAEKINKNLRGKYKKFKQDIINAQARLFVKSMMRMSKNDTTPN